MPASGQQPHAPEQFFTAVRQSFELAAAAGLSERAYRIGDHAVLLRFAGQALERLLTPALEHLSLPLPLSEAPALSVCLFDTAVTGIAPPPPAWSKDAYGLRGEIAGFNTARIRTVYQPGTDVLMTIDRNRAEAIYWTADAGRIPYWEASFPLRTIFHWWLEDVDYQPVHAAAVGRDQGGVLLTGPSGSGKSTTALACLEGGLGYAGDDYVLVRASPAHVFSLYGTAKLEGGNLVRFPHLAALVSNPARQNGEKALLHINSALPGRMHHGFPIRAILVPTITGRRDTALRSVGAGEAFRALAPTTLFHLPGAQHKAISKLGALVRRVPVYRLEAGTELAQIPAAISRLLEDDAVK